MANPYTQSTFLRQTPNELLAEFFVAYGLLPDIDFKALGPRDIDPVMQAIAALPDDQRARVDAAFRDVYALANHEGTRLMIDELSLVGSDAADTLGPMENHYARAMWLFLNREHGGIDVFDTCRAIAEVHDLRFTKTRRLKNLPMLAPRHHDEILTAMAERLKVIYREQGRGYQCHVEHYERPNPVRHYYVAYPEDYSTSDLQYRGSSLNRVNRRAAFQVAYIYRPEEGVLEMHGPGSKKDVQKLQEVFCQLPLGLPGIPDTGEQRCWDLNQLKQPGFSFSTDPVDEIASVEVVALRLVRAGEFPHRLTVEPAARSGVSVYDWLTELLDQDRMPIQRLNVQLAKIRVTFRAEEGKKAPTVTFELTFPDSTTLKDEPRHNLIKRYLKRWKLEA